MSKNGGGNFLLGALIGVGIGMLLAPKSGKELRKDLKIKIDELVAKIKEMDLFDEDGKFSRKLTDIEESITMLSKETILKVAKDKATIIEKDLNDLIEELKESEKEEILSLAQEIKVKANKVIKTTIKKIENTNQA